MIAVIRGPYCTGAVTPCGAAARGGPAGAAARNELMLNHPHGDRQQVEHLTPEILDLEKSRCAWSNCVGRVGLEPTAKGL